MPLGTLDRTPPPFFRQGPSALTRLAFFAALAVFLMAADTRFNMTAPMRASVAAVLNPVERMLLVPVRALEQGRDYAQGLTEARREVDQAQANLINQAQRVAQFDQVELENERLRALLELRGRVNVRSLAAELLYDAPDAYTRKVVIDRGSMQGVVLGAPVINEAGVIGQVTRVYPGTSEVTLLTDREAAIPVLNQRTQQRAVAFGEASGSQMELRFLPASADVQPGDRLATSGLDGVYPSGLPVAEVMKIDRRADSAFARILLTPLADPSRVRHVLVLEPVGLQLPPLPEPDPPRPGERPGERRRGVRR
jgi:rod shape-determining protein MreC